MSQMHPALNILFSLKPPKEGNAVISVTDHESLVDVCPAYAHISQQEARPYFDAARVTLVTLYGLLRDSEWEWILQAVDQPILDQVESLIMENNAPFLANIPQIKILTRNKTAWSAGVALVLAAAYLVIRSAASNVTSPEHLSSEEEKTDAEPSDEPDYQETQINTSPAKTTPMARIVRKETALTSLKEFFKALKAADLDPESSVIRPTECDGNMALEITGTIAAPADFATLARLNAAVKAAWPQAPDLVFDILVVEDSPCFTYRYRID